MGLKFYNEMKKEKLILGVYYFYFNGCLGVFKYMFFVLVKFYIVFVLRIRFMYNFSILNVYL